MAKFIVVILDGFGVGAMDDVIECRHEDVGANTCLHILESSKDLMLQNLSSLGLMNIIDKEVNGMKKNDNAIFGKAKLTHFGADTFFGHQEIMGTKPKKPFTEAIKYKIDEIYSELKKEGYKVEYSQGYKEKFLIVENALTIADNIECDLGQAINVTAALDIVPFTKALEIGRVVRRIVKVPRVITFGGKNISLNDIISAVEEKDNGFIGINAPKSGVYNKGYECIHLGYGVNPETQVPTILGKAGVPVYLLGKAADVIINDYGISIPMVDTKDVLEKTLYLVKDIDDGLICCNVQETDLAGHSENVDRYGEKLIIADKLIGELKKNLKENDILLIMADHGNDPTIGHSKHTREMVPIMIYRHDNKLVDIGIRETLSDVGATISDFFKVEFPENGRSFLNNINNSI